MGEHNEHISEYSKRIGHIIKAESLEGSNGLYFRLTQAALSLTKAGHVVVLVPDQKVLKVVGCCGESTNIPPEFQKSKGVIGRTYQKALRAHSTSYEIVRDVSQDSDYIMCDPQVQSELVVCIFEDNEVELIINAESHQENYFNNLDHVSLITGIGNVAAQCKKKFDLVSKLAHDVGELQEYNELFYTILYKMPDEIMIIDRDYHLVFADEVKMKVFPELKDILPDPKRRLKDFLAGGGQVFCDRSEVCYHIFEKRSSRCERCVCFRAMATLRTIQGIVYKPSFEAFVEISAAPVLLNGKVVGCIEITRSVKQREKVLENVSAFFECVSVKNLLDQIIEILQGPLGYKRVRLYSVDIEGKQLKSEKCSSGHPKIKDFSKITVAIPPELEDGLVKFEKAGLVSTDEAIQSEQSHGYWQVFIPSDKLIQYVDPEGLLELRGVNEFIVVPIVTEKKRLVFCVDNKGQDIKFNSDDLQALTILARFSSLSLGMLERNEFRFKFAVVGETALGLHHMCSRYFARKSPESLSNALIRIYKAGVNYLQTLPNEGQNTVLMQYLDMIVNIAQQPHAIIPASGDLLRVNKPLVGKLHEKQLSLPPNETLEDIMCLVHACDKKNVLQILSETLKLAGDNTAMWEFLHSTLSAIRVFKSQQFDWELNVFEAALKKIALSGTGGEIAEFQVDDLLSMVVTVRSGLK